MPAIPLPRPFRPPEGFSLALTLAAALVGGPGPVSAQVPPQTAVINERLASKWAEVGLKPSRKTDDHEFMRRLFVDLIGRIPSADEVRDFDRDPAPDKRSKLVSRLLRSTGYSPTDPRSGKPVTNPQNPKKSLKLDYAAEYAAHWADLWSVWLMSRGGVHPLYRSQLRDWLEGQFYAYSRYDSLVRDLLTAEGNTSRNGAANFVATHLGEPTPADFKIADGPWEAVPITWRVTRLFLGVRVQCAQCHDHPFNPEWKQVDFWGVNAFFRTTTVDAAPTPPNAENGTHLTLSEDRALNPRREVFFERRNGQVEVTHPLFLPDLADLEAEKPNTPPKRLSKDFRGRRRDALADYVLSHDNFAKAHVNRVWAHLFGRGLNELPAADDFGSHNKLVHPELLAELADEFVRRGYDSKRLIEWIVNSDAYQLSCQVNGLKEGAGGNGKAEYDGYFSRIRPKPLSAEVLLKSLLQASRSEILFDPDDEPIFRRSKRNSTEDLLGKFARFFEEQDNDQADNWTIVQALFLLNGREVNAELTRRTRGTVRNAIARATTTDRFGRFAAPLSETSFQAALDEVFLAALTRYPSAARSLDIAVENKRTKAVTRRVTSEREYLWEQYNVMLDNVRFARDPQGATHGFLEDVLWSLVNTSEFVFNH
jgi:hypothetical protein